MGGDSDRAARVEVGTDVVFRRVEDELVLVKISTNEIYALNPTAARIWELIAQDGDVDGTIAALADEYGEPEDALRGQVEGFVTELRALGFLTS